ncbi:PREDICTED: uncharacterized protein LOC105462420 isoform X2 [Wasmannia auropunctata]|nr:PREDICTED: uncharacterized protein LOC105462420 isoform X2 [Wasmannia auropunctata]
MLPTLIRSTERRTFNEKTDPVETLPRMIGELSIDECAKRNIVSKVNQDSTIGERITERDSKLRTASLYDVDRMSFEELQASLRRITENPRQPFSFLTNISDEFASDKHLSTNPTEIDMQLAAVAQRIESSKILLEEAKSHIENIYLRARQNDVCQLWKIPNIYDDKAKEESVNCFNPASS